ncbi:hypothetical protein CC2G_007590 [Coprinopsis cinerea AmutBmut pab1-1]|nr:hypothetical protein CC2G_007590 [Coprinopsis cinerea AmutBmut pab1-1]
MTTKTSQTPDPVLYLDPHEVERSATLASDRVGHIPADEDKIEVSPQSDAGSPSPSTDLPAQHHDPKAPLGRHPPVSPSWTAIEDLIETIQETSDHSPQP